MAVIELKDVKKVYGKGEAQVVALKDINFKADKGEVVLIMGPSGAGKSTFLTIAGSLQKPTSGQVLINDADISDFSAKKSNELRLGKIGFVLQAYNLVPFLTVNEQFTLVDKVKKQNNLSKAELQDLLKQLGITKLLRKYPGELSGGQQQRAAIARALYANPEILLADEPTASLDTQNVEEVGQLFKDLAKKRDKAVMLVTHDPRLEKYADHIYEMMDGTMTKKK
ncbi:ABC transporter ATP-binding protein [Lactobacillus kefiranofaciens subsp. kefirgranum]|uniref:ABC transporter ATP-binding protein n=1 Tax=Lactobacillus kefiranofaciens TaxID=267818 RepID=UPI0006D08446|nr:ABC transporter ATP-binding protein [Lactobacillus kefiranofaciens]KRL29757.1 ABC transporter ATP-binding protein [Lactobacillus kefiranofaciens subsp. kefirgranum DSM 10550 = JCM 8572]MCJ2172289.1 ABC transporter ATP-binding protein [Lactobacillus kefiranofaciens]MCP9330549.1 ABC transporter ATP-binding protein [Lactobacillus kefiranofaciens]MDF4142712.1 ABC transporter ATP-binding protein [Lactobacillus kefiranofaciens]PAK98341.1 peptide ABC transporter ATP-binding protein [Lactobacillus 